MLELPVSPPAPSVGSGPATTPPNLPTGDLQYRMSVGALGGQLNPGVKLSGRVTELAVRDTSGNIDFTVSEIREVRASLNTLPETSETNCWVTWSLVVGGGGGGAGVLAAGALLAGLGTLHLGLDLELPSSS